MLFRAPGCRVRKKHSAKVLKHGYHGCQSDPKNDPKTNKNPIPASPWPPAGPRGHVFWIWHLFWQHFCAKKQAAGHKVGPNVSEQLPKISDKTYSQNNPKCYLSFGSFPQVDPSYCDGLLFYLPCRSDKSRSACQQRGRRQLASAIRSIDPSSEPRMPTSDQGVPSGDSNSPPE